MTGRATQIAGSEDPQVTSYLNTLKSSNEEWDSHRENAVAIVATSSGVTPDIQIKLALPWNMTLVRPVLFVIKIIKAYISSNFARPVASLSYSSRTFSVDDLVNLF